MYNKIMYSKINRLTLHKGLLQWIQTNLAKIKIKIPVRSMVIDYNINIIQKLRK